MVCASAGYWPGAYVMQSLRCDMVFPRCEMTDGVQCVEGVFRGKHLVLQPFVSST